MKREHPKGGKKSTRSDEDLVINQIFVPLADFYFSKSRPGNRGAASTRDGWSRLTAAFSGLSVSSEGPLGLIAKGTLEMNHERN